MELSFINKRIDDAFINSLIKIFRRSCFAILTVSTALCVTPTIAADSNNMSSARASYQRDRAMCNSGQSNQDRATCLQEAGAAYREARRGQLNDGQAQYDQNALARCNALPPADMQACQRRMMGEGTSEGSSQEGGIYRKIEIPVVMPRDEPN